jgi:hypothetical protein
MLSRICGLIEGDRQSFSEKRYLAPALLPVSGPTLPWPDGLRVVPLLIPVVAPDFILLDFIIFPDFILVPVAPGPTLPSLDAPGAGCVCADAIAVAPNNEATTRAEMASLDRMRISVFDQRYGTQNLQRGLVFQIGRWFFGTGTGGQHSDGTSSRGRH